MGTELGQTSAELIRRGMSIAPTIEIRPGYAYNVMVTQDLVFPGPYDDSVPMRLRPVQTYADVSLKGRVPGELHAVLAAYTSYYRETSGQPIEVWPLIVQMLQRFLETDREFQTWRWRTQSGPGAGSATS